LIARVIRALIARVIRAVALSGARQHGRCASARAVRVGAGSARQQKTTPRAVCVRYRTPDGEPKLKTLHRPETGWIVTRSPLRPPPGRIPHPVYRSLLDAAS
jgi:hypothetical protein